MAAEAIVWKGPEALRPFLVPIGDLEPFPGNPRRGDVTALRGSLRRFGQVLPALVDPELGVGGRKRIVARHHLILAAAEEGWTHIAAIPHTFEDEEEARAYLVADNRLPELGGYDQEALVAQLRALDELDSIEGTGYTREALDDEYAALRALQEQPMPELPSPLDADGKREHRDPAMKELVLLYSDTQLNQAELWLGIIAKEKGTKGTSETVFAGLEIAARYLNQGV